jgi:Domain of unknown function (DUF397)
MIKEQNMTGAQSIPDLPGDLSWRKSTHSGINNCLEVARLPDDAGVAIRSSREPDGTALVFSAQEWLAALAGIKAGEFDDLL